MLQVEIVKDKYGCFFACAPLALFKFVYRPNEKRWIFWLQKNLDPVIFCDEKFPEKFFNDACRAKFFILNGGPMHDFVKITKGGKYVK